MEITTTATSASHVLAFQQPEIDAGDPAGKALLTKAITGADLTHVRCSLRVYINGLGQYGERIGSLIHFTLLDNVGSEAKVNVNLNPAANATALGLETIPRGGAGKNEAESAATLPFGKWFPVEVDVDFAKSYRVVADGLEIFNRSATTSVTKSNGVQVDLGLLGSAFRNDYQVDDVVCDALP